MFGDRKTFVHLSSLYSYFPHTRKKRANTFQKNKFNEILYVEFANYLYNVYGVSV